MASGSSIFRRLAAAVADRCATPPADEPSGRFARWLRGVFALDLRSLAAFRIGIALVVLADLANRARALGAHYTDAGVLPRADLATLDPSPWQWSLHTWSGGWPWQAALFALATIAGLMLLVGWRTRLATVATWVLLASLHGRNHLVLQGGDVLLRCLLFWAMFLPLGARWSIDRARAGGEPAPTSRVLSIAGVAFILQLALMYLFSGWLKHDRLWTSGEAGWYALSIDQLATPFGHWMLGHRDLLRVGTIGMLWFERLAPFALLIAAHAGARLLLVAAFMAAHIAMWACLELGPFPYVAWAGWAAVIPGAFWDRLGAFAPRVGAWAARFGTRFARAGTPAPTLYGRSRAEQAVCAYYLVLVALWNWRTLEWSHNAGAVGLAEHLLPRDCNWMVETPRLDQYWSMFAPHPLVEDGWYDVPATLADGQRVDLLTRGPPSSAKPEDVAARYDGERWRKYLMNLSARDHRAAREPFARWLRASWDESHPPEQRIARFEIAYWIEPTTSDGVSPLRREILWSSE